VNRRSFLLGSAALFASPGPAAAEKPRDLPLEPQQITVTARPIRSFKVGEPERRRFGDLDFLGGLELASTFRGFGGFSGLRFTDAAGRRFLAVSDAGIWLEGTLTAEGETPTGVTAARMAPMRDERGRSVAGTWRGDAESLALRGDEAFVGFEAINEIRRFSRAGDVLVANGSPIPVPAGVRDLRRSRGLEGLDVFPARSRHAGALFAAAESPLREESHMRAWIIGGPAPGQLRIVQREDYDLTEVAFLPSGDLLILERRVRIPFGAWFRIRRVEAARIQAGATLDGPVVIEADMTHTIDNMEALAVHRAQDGAHILTIMSDDNYSLLQRTILLRFRLAE